MALIDTVPVRQRSTCFYIARHETRDYGVIVQVSTAAALLRRGLAIEAPRRRYARGTGICLRLTDLGRQLMKETEA